MELIKDLKALEDKLNIELSSLNNEFEAYKELLNNQLVQKAQEMKDKEESLIQGYEKDKATLLKKANDLLQNKTK